MNSEDCLVNITERPFPKDVILQVEVYNNKSEIWLEREKALQDLYNRMYNRSHIHNIDDRGSRHFMSTGWIRDYCETSLFINLTGARFFCQLILTELGGSEDSTMELNYTEARDGVPDSMWDSCAKEDLNDYINRYYKETSMEKEKLSISAFYSKNYTLYDLMEFYSKLVDEW